MNITTLERQIAPVAEGRRNMADVQTPRGKLVVLSHRLGETFRPLLEFMADQISAGERATTNSNWTDEKNARRVELINKQYASTLTSAERLELKKLQAESEKLVDRLREPRNKMLELLLLGLEHSASQPKTRR